MGDGFKTGELQDVLFSNDGSTCDITIDGVKRKVWRTKKDGSVKGWFDAVANLPQGQVSYATDPSGKYLNYVGVVRNGNGGGGAWWGKAQGSAPQQAPPAPPPQQHSRASSYEDGMAFGNLMNVIAAVKRAEPAIEPEDAVQWVLQARKLLDLGLKAEKANDDVPAEDIPF